MLPSLASRNPPDTDGLASRLQVRVRPHVKSSAHHSVRESPLLHGEHVLGDLTSPPSREPFRGFHRMKLATARIAHTISGRAIVTVPINARNAFREGNFATLYSFSYVVCGSFAYASTDAPNMIGTLLFSSMLNLSAMKLLYVELLAELDHTRLPVTLGVVPRAEPGIVHVAWGVAHVAWARGFCQRAHRDHAMIIRNTRGPTSGRLISDDTLCVINELGVVAPRRLLCEPVDSLGQDFWARKRLVIFLDLSQLSVYCRCNLQEHPNGRSSRRG